MRQKDTQSHSFSITDILCKLYRLGAAFITLIQKKK